MTPRLVIVAALLALILGVPFALRPSVQQSTAGGQAQRLIVVTPHVEQIRREFAAAFDRWHRRRFGEPAEIDWRAPGGTSDILKQLEAQFAAAIKAGRFDFAVPTDPRCEPGTIGYDAMLGGGSYDHGRLKRGVPVPGRTLVGPDGKQSPLIVPMSRPAGLEQKALDDLLGDNAVGTQKLYDPQQFWIGTALSSFGIVYNRELIGELGLPEPRTFADLTDLRYAGRVALSDPRQSGSIATTFDSILNVEGWERGWRILRGLSANSRTFTNSSTKPPIDVSAAEAAAGLAIDFYGRTQAEAVRRRGSPDRVAYIEPRGSVYVDADPVSILRGGPNPELARRLVEFCLSDEAQLLWQLPPGTSVNAVPPPSPGAAGEPRLIPGPEHYALRRLPIRRDVYARYGEHFTDKVNPFDIASTADLRGWRSAIGPMMGAFAIDIADEQRAAWAAINRVREQAGRPGAPPTLAERVAAMETVFFSWPTHRLPDGRELEFNEANFGSESRPGEILKDWPGRKPRAETRIAYTAYFRGCYARVRRMADEP